MEVHSPVTNIKINKSFGLHVGDITGTWIYVLQMF